MSLLFVLGRGDKKMEMRTHMRKHDSIRTVDVERLSFRMGRTSSSRVTDMSDTHPSFQTLNSVAIKHVPDHAVRLDLVKATPLAASDNTGRILTTMLQERKTLDTV